MKTLQNVNAINAKINDMRIAGVPEATIAEIKNVLLPPLPEKKGHKGKTEKIEGPAFPRGNDGQFQSFLYEKTGMFVNDLLEAIQPVTGNSEIAGNGIEALLSWLLERSPAGSKTYIQNAEHVRYIKKAISGESFDRDGEVARSKKALAAVGSAWQIFDNNGNLRKWYHDNTPSMVKILTALNAI